MFQLLFQLLFMLFIILIIYMEATNLEVTLLQMLVKRRIFSNLLTSHILDFL